MLPSKTIYLREIEKFLKRHKMFATDFGLRFLQNPGYVFALRKGRAPTLDTVDKVHKAMAKYEKENKKS